VTDRKGHGFLVHSGLACPRLSRINRILLLLSLLFWLVQNPSSYPATSNKEGFPTNGNDRSQRAWIPDKRE
ncbi:hypothetical protein COZ13_06175, partial [Candidatus Desantisbacteria bacterium CG_4_10_14_3_um_filter_40_18]